MKENFESLWVMQIMLDSEVEGEEAWQTISKPMTFVLSNQLLKRTQMRKFGNYRILSGVKESETYLSIITDMVPQSQASVNKSAAVTQ